MYSIAARLLSAGTLPASFRVGRSILCGPQEAQRFHAINTGAVLEFFVCGDTVAGGYPPSTFIMDASLAPPQDLESRRPLAGAADPPPGGSDLGHSLGGQGGFAIDLLVEGLHDRSDLGAEAREPLLESGADFRRGVRHVGSEPAPARPREERPIAVARAAHPGESRAKSR